MRVTIRWLLRVLAVVAWLIALALGLVTIASRTDWGRRKLAQALEAKLETIFDADVRVERVEGRLPGQIVVRGVRVDRAGETVLQADRLELRWDVLAVRRRTFHVDELTLDGATVRTDRLAGILRPARPSAPWRLRVDHLTVHDGRLLSEGRTLERIALEGRIDWTGPDGWASLAGATVHWKERDLTAVARGHVARRGGHTLLVDARVDVPGVGWLWVPLLIDRSALASFDVPGQAHGAAMLAGDEVAVAAQVKRAPLRLQVVGRGNLREREVTVRLDGRIGNVAVRGLRLEASQRGDEIRVLARMGRDRARAFLRQRGETLSGWVEASIDRPTLDLDARAQVSRRGGTTRFLVERLAFTARQLHGEARSGEVILHENGGLTVSRLDVVTEAGRLEVSGTLAGMGRRQREDARLHLHSQSLDLGRLREALALAALPRRGVLTADLHAARKGRELVIDGELSARGLLWRPGDPPLDARARIELAPGRLEAQAVLEAHGGGRAAVQLRGRAPRHTLDAGAWARLAADDLQSARIELADLDLAVLARVLGRPGAARGTVAGTVIVPERGRRIEAELTGRGLLGRDADAELTLAWDARGLDARLVGHLGGARVGEATLELQLPLRASLARAREVPLVAHVRVENFPLDRLNRAGLVRAPLSGSLRATVDVGGSLANPRASGEARLLGGHLGRVRFYEVHVQGAGDRRGARGTVDALQAEGGRVHAELDLPVAAGEPGELELKASKLDLGFLAALAPDTGVGGRLDADLRVSGTRAAPAASGTVRVREGRVIVEGGARLLEGIVLDARLTPGRIVLEHLWAKSGAGAVSASGATVLEGLRPRRFAVKVQTRRLAVRAGTRVVAVDAEGELTGRAGSEGWAIDAIVQRGFVRMPRERREKLQRVGPLEDVVYVDARARREQLARAERGQRVAGAPPKLTIHVTAPRGARVRGPDVDARVTGDLEIEIGNGRTTVAGFVEVQQGTAVVFDRRYEIVYARAWYDGHSADPLIEVRLAHEFKTAILYISLDGTLSRPRLRLSSDPAVYDDAQLLGFVLGGDPDDPALADRRLDDRATGVASGLVVSQVRNRLRQVLPVDVLRVELAEDPSGSQGARFEIGKWLTDNLLIGYRYRSTTAEEDNTNEATFEWHFLPRWLLEARYGDRGVGSADLLWRKRY